MGRTRAERKKEVEQIISEAKKGFKRLSEGLGTLARKGEEGILKASKVGKVQLDIMSLNVQKEKLYYDIGKKIVSLDIRKKLDIPELDTYRRKLEKLEEELERKKELLARVKKEAKKEDV